LASNWGGEGEVVVVEEWERRANINRDAVDVDLKLRSPPQIAFDMSVYLFDSKIKNCCIL
jgi:hypothetical protein